MAVPQSFPAKIYQILENESPDIIQWNENGVSFRIVDHGRFEREIVPKYFRHNQISSVQRQLNLYGFKCISRGEFKRSFFHPKFRRGDWETVRKLTRFVPIKKTSQLSDDIPITPDSAANSDDRKRDERMVQPTMYNPYFYPIPGANMPGQPGPDYMARNYMMAASGAQPNGAWPESWDRQESTNNLNARMMGMPSHFAYSMIPMHAAAAMQQHMTSGTPLHSTSSSNVARLDSTRSSELSNRLGFKFGVNGVVAAVEHPALAANNSTSTSSSASALGNTNTSSIHAEAPVAVPRVQENPDHAQALALAHAHAHAHHNNSGNSEYDFMVEFGMFDGMHMPELPHSHSSHSHLTGPLPSVGQMRLPTVTHGLVPDAASSDSQRSISGSGSNNPSPVHSTGSSASLHAHASLEVDASSSAHHSEDNNERVKSAQVATSTSMATPAATTVTVRTTTSCDMGCNTLLTYSKIHDALVYRVGDL